MNAGWPSEKQLPLSTIIIESQNRIMYLWRRLKAKCVTEILGEMVKIKKLGSRGVNRRLCLKCCETHLQACLCSGGLYPLSRVKNGSWQKVEKGKGGRLRHRCQGDGRPWKGSRGRRIERLQWPEIKPEKSGNSKLIRKKEKKNYNIRDIRGGEYTCVYCSTYS